MDFSTDETLQSVRIRADLPDSDARFTDAVLQFLLNEELQSWLVPLILEMRSEYLVQYVDLPISVNQHHYPIPPQASAGRLRLIQMLDTSGEPQLPALTQIDPRDQGPYSLGTWGTFFIRGDVIVLLGSLPQGWTLRVSFEVRPNQCVLKAACAQVTALNGAQVTVASFPWGTGVAVDFLKGGSSWQTIGTATMPAPSGGVATFAAVPYNLAVGDWLALAGQAPFCQVPQECVPILRQWLACKCLEIKGDEKVSVSTAMLAKVEAAMKTVLAPRVQGNLKQPVGILGQRSGFWGAGPWSY